MVGKSLVVGTLFAVALSTQALSCPYMARYEALKAQESPMLARVNAMSDERRCSAEGRRLINDLIGVTQKIAAIIRQAQADKACDVTNAGAPAERIAALRAMLQKCTAQTPPTTTQPPNCTTPPKPGAVRIDPTYMCFTARNTNTDSRCVYSFTYRLSNRPNPQDGGNVPAGGSQERCSQQRGVNISFETWTRIQPSGR